MTVLKFPGTYSEASRWNKKMHYQQKDKEDPEQYRVLYGYPARCGVDVFLHHPLLHGRKEYSVNVLKHSEIKKAIFLPLTSDEQKR